MRSIESMQAPATDSAEYADLLEHIGSAIQLPAVVEDDAAVNFPWSVRATAMTRTFLAMAAAAARPPA